MSWEGGDRGDAGLRRGHPLSVGRPLDGAGGEEVAGAGVVPVPVHVVREVLALGLVLALGGAGEEGGHPGEVRDEVVLAAGAIVRTTAVGKLGWHGKPDSQDVEEDDGQVKTHFVGVGCLGLCCAGCLGLNSESIVLGIYAPPWYQTVRAHLMVVRCARHQTTPRVTRKLCGLLFL